MARPITVVKLAALLAKRVGISVPKARAFLQAQAELAYEHARAGCPIAGIGVLKLTERPERKSVIRSGPRQGQEVTIPARKELHFWLSKVAMDHVCGPPAPPPDVFRIKLFAHDFFYDGEEDLLHPGRPARRRE
jgi:nucleoid DNA-binding protein